MNIPNSLSVFRLMLIPTFVIVFFMPQSNSYLIAGFIFLLSGITDFLDGYIARKFGLITDLGKVLDPLADKLTQFTVFYCLWMKNIIPLWAVCIYIVKEVVMLVGGTSIYNKNKIVVASKWYGKVATALFYAGVMVVLLFDLSADIKRYIIFGALAATVFAFLMYIITYFKLITTKNKSQKT
ncbi:MAG: CDP-diacylglycerol--glycerol-3-phosphate 3-phosphatidyltransferase [Bacillota bacterium]|nr:CDP-diacylglycerol--glycerol-3-phosphate 3-phosphatidyltransferase [Bacillota bacterium]